MYVSHPCFTIVFNMCYYVLAFDAGPGTTFRKITTVYVDMVQPGQSWTAPSPVSCVAACLRQFKCCYSVVFDDESKTCTPGAWLTPSHAPRDLAQGALYTSGAFCDTSVGFNVIFYGSLILCTKMSTMNQTYDQGKTECQERRGHLYTLKTPKKLDFLRYFYPTGNDLFWVGLDDMRTRGVFRWADDGSMLTEEMASILFQLGHPYNKSERNCAVYNGYAKSLIDIPCVVYMQHLCEVTPFPLLDIEELIQN